MSYVTISSGKYQEDWVSPLHKITSDALLLPGNLKSNFLILVFKALRIGTSYMPPMELPSSPFTPDLRQCS